MIKVSRARSVTKSDLAAVKRILPQLSAKARHLQLSEYRAVLRDKNNVFFAARDKGVMVGMATLVMVQTTTGRRGWIEDVVVDSAYRGQGIGYRLCRALIVAAKKYKLLHVDLTTRPERVAANKLYQRLGFEKRETNVYRLKLK